MITQKEVKELFDYVDGKLISKNEKSKRFGQDAGALRKKTGYVYVYAKRKTYSAHRIVFLWHHGYFPEYVDHINRIKHDNRIENLRSATVTQNVRNRNMYSNNTSGHEGIWFNKKINRWVAYTSINKEKKHIGQFINLDDAVEARKEFMKKHLKI